MSANFAPINAAETSATEQSRKELQDRLNGLGGISGRRLDPEAKAKKLREACEGFESIFIQKMWQEMRDTVPKGGLLQSREEKFWQDMYDQELSKSMTRAGGIGLADMMYEQLSRGLGDASRAAASATSGQAFTPEAAPLIPAPAGVDQLADPEENIMTAEIAEPAPLAPPAQAPVAASPYEGEAPSVAENAENEAQANAQAATHAVLPTQTPEAEKMTRPPVEHAAKPARVKATAKPEKVRDNGLDLAYQAKREAGDKLGARAIRPPLKARKERATEEAAQAQPAMPGSAEALKAAVAMARAGATLGDDDKFDQSLSELVARAQAGAANAQNLQAAAQTVASVEESQAPESVAPHVRRVRYTTNAPKKNQAQKGSDAIRTLNVDNVGANGKAGKGLAAYHAAQKTTEAEKIIDRPGAAQTEERPVFDIPPLTSSDLLG